MTQTQGNPAGAWAEPKATAVLVLADGTVLEGFCLGATVHAVSEYTSDRSEGCLSTLGAVVSVDGPWPADGLGDENTNGPRSHPYDYVVGSPDLAAGMVPVEIGTQSFAAGLVVDTRVYTPIEDLAPALATDSAATNMQHMAVVRDFLVAE